MWDCHNKGDKTVLFITAVVNWPEESLPPQNPQKPKKEAALMYLRTEEMLTQPCWEETALDWTK